jgi:hypothetical protein
MNMEMEEYLQIIQSIDPSLTYIHENASTVYDTENRVQERNRSGWSGV